MKKVILRLFIKNRKKPLFECEIIEDVESTIRKLEDRLNDRTSDAIHFGQVCFARSEFEHFEIIYK